MSEKIFKGFKQVLRAEYENAVTGGTALGYIWFVRPDSGNTSEGDIYLGTRHYGHFGENDLADLTSKVTNICNSVGLVADGTFEGFTTDFINGASSFADAIDTIATKVNELVTTIDSKVASVAASDNSIEVNNLDPKNPKIKVKVSADSANTLTVKEDGLFVNVPEEVPYSGKESVKVSGKEISLQINATDKILSQSDSGLLATISLVQDVENSLHYTLTGKDGANLGEINIPKDQFLKEASFVSAATEADKLIDDNVVVGDPYLKFVFQTNSEDKTVYVSVKQLVDVYEGGNGIEISDNTVSLKLDPSTEKYLTLGENGLKLSGVDAAIADALTGGTGELNLVSDVTKSGDTFTVEYSNSESSELKLNYASSMDDSLTTPKAIGGLAAGTSAADLKKKTISQILDDIIFEEINPTIVAPSASISLTNGFSNNGVYEVNAAAPQENNFTKSFNRGSITVVGQSGKYRAGEERIMKRLLSGAPCVLASGGGAFVADQTRSLAKKNALTIWLKADIDVLYNRTAGRKRRPFLQCSDSKIKSKLQTYIDEEYPYYSEADIMVETRNEAVECTVGRVMKAIETYLNDKTREKDAL